MSGPQKGTPWLAYGLGGFMLFVALSVYLAPPSVSSDPDAQFCHQVFTQLAKGKPEAAKHIDWARFKAIGVDLGAGYAQFPGPQHQAMYQRTFIMNFANGFRMSGAKPNTLTNWRVVDREGERTTVAADHRKAKKTLLFVVNSAEPRLLEEIQWQDAG
jgi:hypothetical protein